MTVVAPTDRLKSVRNCCVIELLARKISLDRLPVSLFLKLYAIWEKGKDKKKRLINVCVIYCIILKMFMLFVDHWIQKCTIKFQIHICLIYLHIFMHTYKQFCEWDGYKVFEDLRRFVIFQSYCDLEAGDVGHGEKIWERGSCGVDSSVCLWAGVDGALWVCDPRVGAELATMLSIATVHTVMLKL